MVPLMSVADRQELAKYPSVYEGSDYVLTMLRTGEHSRETVLIKVEGIDNDFDGQIYLHSKKCEDTRCTAYRYETSEVPGKARWWTVQSVGSSYGHENLIMYPPGIDTKTAIHKVKRPGGFNAEKFYAEYLGQKLLRK